MIIEHLSVTDFRVFRGKHDFNLRPRIKYGKQRPIVLFGGLNGAGKTTTLTAIRLALYGRQSLGHGTTKKAYEEFLRNSIHRSTTTPLTPSSAAISLSFTYATLGVEKRYTIDREWYLKNDLIVEKLSILDGESALSELSADQCQAFLNELIPIGVSDLFFFDGEKIAELAEDTGGAALGDAIKKLLGLNVIETLSADLSLLSRNQLKQFSSKAIQEQICTLEEKLSQHEMAAKEFLYGYESAKADVLELQANADKIEHELSSKGGAWAATREEELVKQSTLNSEKTVLENQIREILGSEYPIALARNFCRYTQKLLNDEKSLKNHRSLALAVSKELEELGIAFEQSLPTNEAKLARKILNDKQLKYSFSDDDEEIVHDISDTDFARFNSTVDSALESKASQLELLSERLEEVQIELDNAGKNIARAPEQDHIKPYLDTINHIRSKLVEATDIRAKTLEAYKRELRDAIDTTRKLDKLAQEKKATENAGQSLSLASSAQKMLKEFSIETAKRKVNDLELEFVRSFKRLARKDDADLRARISSKDFSVTLIDQTGVEVNKDDLSAGEKQIYAIAILEALAKTSGRHLPIIIDTPLGRLDSVHRKKLISNYFPSASHQVIILSTDTEVDESFYEELSKSVSHAYRLDYDSNTASTFANEGYFWRKNAVEIV
ncbi:Uncharacterised protein [BD1-7 clade bacterium]|uniref:Rad50/SbcC-type AAA domain-containing protein n=1 Tax=BD1-7 clade bacterium TaxID=2029982 RepID=A0A5S9P3P0_9GAMM|nr:Uncharacterised protein [BD1-7 clade bacterium]CAA0122962.1 Uncharacterised protein [BD1-7 clade bacterium]